MDATLRIAPRTRHSQTGGVLSSHFQPHYRALPTPRSELDWPNPFCPPLFLACWSSQCSDDPEGRLRLMDSTTDNAFCPEAGPNVDWSAIDKLKNIFSPTLDAVTITLLQGSKTRSRISPEQTAPATPSPDLARAPTAGTTSVHGNHRRPGPRGSSRSRHRSRNRNLIWRSATRAASQVLFNNLYRRLAAEARRRDHSVWIPLSFMSCDRARVQLKEAPRGCWHQKTVLSVPFVPGEPTTKPVTVAQHQ
ncbi:hypothetical protein B0T18DRAFT_254187 [Schizothecium vesticola]|uniref:Uncharacterized protein n=1 Tax=Schizothecium vesticola TaxID=314040 RepID=A0AA40BR52_9PEZI|nr:hypothetical protein B0T18DRAFT_254187 [Schizothecium vesticola]